MPEHEHLAVLRALADTTRLRMLRTLGNSASSAEDLATRLGLAPSTVSFHLKKLELAGLISGRREQYYSIFSRDEEALTPSLRDIVDALPPASSAGSAGADRITRWRAGVLRQYMRRGRLLRLPRQHAKRWVVLEAIAESFRLNSVYTEPEVNTILSAIHEDHCTLRRTLVDEGVLERSRDTFKRVQAGPARPGSLRASYEASLQALKSSTGED